MGKLLEFDMLAPNLVQFVEYMVILGVLIYYFINELIKC